MATIALKAGAVFLKRKHELDDLLKQLDRVTPEAVDLLVDTMNNPKEAVKVRVACADKLLDYKIKVSEAINKDELTRQIAEIKASGLKTPLVGDDVPKPAAPRLDMNNIQEV
jgi:hypothetical protein